MKAADQKLQGVLYSPNQYVIPVFQRFYRWGKENWQRLWDDLAEMQEEAGNTRSHFMGSLVFVPERHYPDRVPAYQVIDGQQRLITISLLLCALRNVAREAGFLHLKDEIEENFLIHKHKKGPERYRIYPRQRDRDQYLAALESGTVAGGK